MPRKKSTFVNALLTSLQVAGGIAEFIVYNSSPYRWRHWALYGRNYNSYRNNVSQLRRRGLVDVQTKNGKKFLKLTAKGQLELLLLKAKSFELKKWDGKWRVIIFDIPENAKNKRNHFRFLLKINNFKKLQGSVYVSPYPLNRDAVAYLQKTELINFIRIMKVEEMDNDLDLRKKFNL